MSGWEEGDWRNEELCQFKESNLNNKLLPLFLKKSLVDKTHKYLKFSQQDRLTVLFFFM